MEMHQIRYFLTVAETLNFTRAAEACNVSQPSLSQAIRKLEDELGGELFRRERGHSHLTELGRSMLPLLRQCHESALAAKEQAGHYRSADYAPLRVGLSESVPLAGIAPALAELARAYPGLALHLERGPAETILAALKAGDLEVAIAGAAIDDWDRFDCWPLFEETLLVVSKSDDRGPIALAELVAEGLVGRAYCETARAFAEAVAERELELTFRHESGCDLDAVGLAGSGLGVAVLPASAARALAGGGQPIADLDLTRTVAVYGVAGRRHSPAASGLLRLLRTADWEQAGA